MARQAWQVRLDPAAAAALEHWAELNSAASLAMDGDVPTDIVLPGTKPVRIRLASTNGSAPSARVAAFADALQNTFNLPEQCVLKGSLRVAKQTSFKQYIALHAKLSDARASDRAKQFKALKLRLETASPGSVEESSVLSEIAASIDSFGGWNTVEAVERFLSMHQDFMD